MKKLPHQLPSRKSPRLSSSSSPAAAAAASSSPSSTRTRNEPKPRPDDAWALSLHVAEQQPLPQEDNSLRRSTRLASKTPSPQSRTSPTLFPSSSAPALTLSDGENVGRRESRCLSGGDAAAGSLTLSERCLRSRTVLMKRVVSERRGRGKAAAENGGETPQIEMLALPPATPVSRNAKTQLREESVELNKEQCSSEGVSEKRLRSRSIQLKLNVAENAVRKRDQKGGGWNEESAVRSRSVQLKQNVAENAVRKADQKGGGWNEESAVRSGKKKGILCCFVGEPIPEEEAQRRWQWRYDLKVNAC